MRIEDSSWRPRRAVAALAGGLSAATDLPSRSRTAPARSRGAAARGRGRRATACSARRRAVADRVPGPTMLRHVATGPAGTAVRAGSRRRRRRRSCRRRAGLVVIPQRGEVAAPGVGPAGLARVGARRPSRAPLRWRGDPIASPGPRAGRHDRRTGVRRARRRRGRLGARRRAPCPRTNGRTTCGAIGAIATAGSGSPRSPRAPTAGPRSARRSPRPMVRSSSW